MAPVTAGSSQAFNLKPALHPGSLLFYGFQLLDPPSPQHTALIDSAASDPGSYLINPLAQSFIDAL